MTDADISNAKAELRTEAKRQRSLAAQQHGTEAAQKFAAHGIDFADHAPPAVVSGYMPFGDEADIAPLLAKLSGQGHRVALPVIVAKAQPLEFRAWTPGADLGSGQWGIQEPPADSEVLVPDVMLCPLLAFDDDGYRLGYGGGYYDRSLAKFRAMKPVVCVGVAFDEQRVGNVPRDRYDQRLDWLMTPSGVKKFN